VVAASLESGTVVVNDDKEAEQKQTRWNAWLEKGEHTDTGASVDGVGQTVASSVAQTSSNFTV